MGAIGGTRIFRGAPTLQSRLRDATCGSDFRALLGSVVEEQVTREVANRGLSRSDAVEVVLRKERTQAFFAAVAGRAARLPAEDEGRTAALSCVDAVLRARFPIFEARAAVSVAWAMGKVAHPNAHRTFSLVAHEFAARRGVGQLAHLTLVSLVSTAVRMHDLLAEGAGDLDPEAAQSLRAAVAAVLRGTEERYMRSGSNDGRRVTSNGRAVLAKGLCALGADEAVVVPLLRRVVQGGFTDLSPSLQSTVVSSMARSGVALDLLTPTGHMIAARLIQSYRQKEFVATLWAYAHVERFHAPLLEQVAKYIELTGLSTFNASAVRSVCHCLARLEGARSRDTSGTAVPPLGDLAARLMQSEVALNQSAQPANPSAEERSLLRTLHTAARLSRADRGMFDSAVDKVLSSSNVAIRTLSDVTFAHHTAGMPPSARLVDLLAARGGELTGASLGFVMTTLAAHARVGHPVFEAVNEGVEARAGGLSVRTLADVLAAYAKAGYGSAATQWYYVRTVNWAAEPKAAEEDLRQAARIGAALAAARVYNSPLGRVVMDRALEMEKAALRAPPPPGSVPSPAAVQRMENLLMLLRQFGSALRQDMSPLLHHLDLRCATGVVPKGLLPDVLRSFRQHGWDGAAVLAAAAKLDAADLAKYRLHSVLFLARSVVEGGACTPAQFEAFEADIARRVRRADGPFDGETEKNLVLTLGSFADAGYEGQAGCYHAVAARLPGAVQALDPATLCVAFRVLAYVYVDTGPLLAALAARYPFAKHSTSALHHLHAAVPEAAPFHARLTDELARRAAIKGPAARPRPAVEFEKEFAHERRRARPG
eukprot:TRINITY_DN20875_c0_g1_i1.p1 TRINITY_DN20875_c0_g1~~TRINITY_DN20875_c0_g1_i1.p1  ORF type:complete len:824 (+),score=182.81 TRINITY_DN20875_c0_g1_i1:88-2559(+)